MRILKNYGFIFCFLSEISFLLYIEYVQAAFLILSAAFCFMSMLQYQFQIKKFESKQTEVIIENEQKECYVASVVHDLKNSLIGQCRISENLLRKNRHDKTICENITQMLLSARTMLEMVMTVTNTYKYSNGQINYKPEVINAHEMVAGVCRELTYLTEEEKLVKIDVQSDNQFIFADKMHIRRVISNLVSNALKYKRENSRINIKLVTRNNFFVFSVSSFGHYIPKEQQQEIFRKYVSKDKSFNSFSTGLGLYLSKKIIEGHGGKMFVISSYDGENKFGFSIPQSLVNYADIQNKISGENKKLEVLKNFT